MNGFRFFMPVDTYFGTGCIQEHKEVLCCLGKKAMIVTGRHSAKANGSQADMTTALDTVGIEWILFDEVGENPDVETVVRAAELAKKEKVEFIVGIGGGSPMDASKAIAVLAANPDAKADILFTKKNAAALPVVEVPTTAGTGSEVTQYAVMTLHEKRTKSGIAPSVFPQVSFLDPAYMDTLSVKNTNNTAVDTLSHLVESYLSAKSNEMSRKLAEIGLDYWKNCIPALKRKVYTEEDREKLMMASAMGGIVIAQTGTSLPHGLGYFLTYEKGIPHGRANGMLLEAYLELFGKDNEEVKKILKLLDLTSTAEVGVLMKEILDITETFTEEDIQCYTKRMMETPQKLKTFPLYELKEEDVQNIYRRSLL